MSALGVPDAVKRLIGEYLELERSEENARRRAKWAGLPRTARDQFRPVPMMDGSWKRGNVPVVVDFQNPWWASFLGFDLKEHYTEPASYLENHLRICIERFRLVHDDYFLEPYVPVWLGSGFEASLFGIRTLYSADSDPWMEQRELVHSRDDIERLRFPDIRASGLMPLAWRMHGEISEMVGGALEVGFPEWNRGPVGVAMQLRGFASFLTDAMLEPDAARLLLGKVVQAKKAWCDKVFAELGRPVGKGNLFNDEVNVPSFSPRLYRELVLPFEQELCRYHGGLFYWHSCGDCSVLLPGVVDVGPVDMIHVGPWTDAARAASAFGRKAPLEVCMNPQADVLTASAEQMAGRLEGVLRGCEREGALGLTLRANALNSMGTDKYTLQKALEWLKTARETTERFSME